MIVNLTRWAENKFNGTCNEAGVSCSKSTEDVEGWDYICDWPVRAIEQVPHDRRGPALTARAQVKSCENPPPVATINLKNALRYAQSETPYFIVVYVATDHAHPVHCYAVHVWDALIARILRRSRQAYADKREDLHKISFSITLTEGDRHDDDLLQWMEETIRSVSPDYAAAKRLLNSTLGYPEAQFVGNMTFSESALSEFIDHSIGLTPTFTANTVRIVDKRFGIEVGRPEFEGKDVVATITVEPRECSLTLINDSGDTRTVEGKAYLPPIAGLPIEMMKSRISGGFFDIIASKGGDLSFNIHIEPDQMASIDMLEQVSFMASAIDRGAVEVEIRRPGMPTFSLGLPQTRNNHAEILAAPQNVLSALQNIGTRTERSQVGISFSALADAWESALKFVLFISSSVRTSASFDTGASAAGLTKRLLAYGYVHIGEWTFYAIVERRVAAEVVDGTTLATTFSPPRVLASSISPTIDFIAQDMHRAEFERWLSRNRSGTVIMLDGCFNDVLGGQSIEGLTLGPVPVGTTQIFLDP